MQRVLLCKYVHSYDSLLLKVAKINMKLLLLSPSAWAYQRSCQGDIIVITIISPCPETFKITVLTPIYSCLYTRKLLS